MHMLVRCDTVNSTLFFPGHCYTLDGSKKWGNRSGLGHAKARRERDFVNSKLASRWGREGGSQTRAKSPAASSRVTSKHVFLLIYSLT